MATITDDLVKSVEAFTAQRDINISAESPAPQGAAEPETPQEVAPVENIVVDVIAPVEEEKEIPMEDADLNYANSLRNENQEKEKTFEAKGEVSQEDRVLIENAKAILSDKRLTQFKEFLDKGGNFVDFAKTIVGEDTSKLTDEQLHDQFLATQNLTEDELKEEQASFASKTRLERASLVKPMREAKQKEQENKAKDYINSVPDQRAKVSEAATQAIKELDSSKENYVGKKLHGILVTEESFNQIAEELKTGGGIAVPKVVNGQFAGYDIPRSIELNYLEKNLKNILKSHIEIGRTIGWNEFYKKRTRPATQPVGSIPVSSMTASEAADQAFGSKDLTKKNN